ncbi:MAG TPA: sugar phosphate isomerase/epimerase [Actinobacteria bacterium]|nr:sugar phosphate isomerase/epimerase [Actinomycetota bacterium]
MGIEIFYFMDRWSDDQTAHFHLARRCGYDGVEISLMPDSHVDLTGIRAGLDEHGLSIVCSTGLNESTDISHPDPAVRRSGVEYLKRCLETAGALGSPILGGVVYAPWFAFPGDGDLEPYRQRSAESLREVAVAADAVGVDLCVELLNRFETYMLNTVDQGNAFLDLIGHPSVRIELDTFHMNMEETDLAGAIRKTGDRLGHFQCAANNRAMPGKGHVDWDGIATALDDISYSGWVVVETFPNPSVETGRSTHAWRPLVEDLIGEATEAAAFVRTHLGGAPLVSSRPQAAAAAKAPA